MQIRSGNSHDNNDDDDSSSYSNSIDWLIPIIGSKSKCLCKFQLSLEWRDDEPEEVDESCNEEGEEDLVESEDEEVAEGNKVIKNNRKSNKSHSNKMSSFNRNYNGSFLIDLIIFLGKW